MNKLERDIIETIKIFEISGLFLIFNTVDLL